MVVRWLGILVCALALNAQEVRLQVLTTTDLRGHVLPQDSFTLQPANLGWAKLATVIRGLRAANANTLLVDCGDATQGEPIDYVWSQLNSKLPEPSMAIMNDLGYNAMVVGSHEFDHGLAKLRTLEDQAQFPWLAANVMFTADGRRVFTPYVLLNIGGIQVAVLGLTTPAQPVPRGDGLVFLDPIATAKALIPLLREKEKVDMVVVALHGGPGAEPCGGGEENEARCLTSQVPGIDLVLTSHARLAMDASVNGVPVLQAGLAGASVGAGEFVFRRGARGKWDLQSHRTWTASSEPETGSDARVLELTAPLRAATETYLNTLATNLATDLDGRWTRMEDTPLMHLLHTVARQASGAQITALATPGSRIFIPKGITSVRQFYALYPTENRIARIRVTGRQLRAYLEQTARFYNFSHNPDLYNKTFDPADFDTLDGCSYALDISRPPGARVVDLEVQDHPVKDEQVFTLGLGSDRLSGAGGYLEAMGWTGEPEFISPVPFRNLLLEYVLSRSTLAPVASDNWHIIPALDRERVLAQQP